MAGKHLKENYDNDISHRSGRRPERGRKAKKSLKVPVVAAAVSVLLAIAVFAALRISGTDSGRSPRITVSPAPSEQPAAVSAQPVPEPTLSPEEIRAQEEAERKKAEELKAEASKYSFYQKLEKGYDTNILILGDSTAADPAGDAVNGIVDGPKFSGLSEYLEEKYSSDVTVTDLAVSGGNLLADAMRVLNMPEEPSYDLVILSYGLNDENEMIDNGFTVQENDTVWPNYSALLLTLSNRFPNCSIICTLEPCFQEITHELYGMQRVSMLYGIPVIDMVSALSEKGDNAFSDCLEQDRTLNEKGMREWISLICEAVDENVSKSAEKMRRVETYIEKSIGVSQLSFIPVSDVRVSRRDETSYTVDIKAKGLSYIQHKKPIGRDDAKVIADDMLYSFAKPKGVETAAGSYITLLHEQMLCEKSFEIIFSDRELADGLEGFYFVEYSPEENADTGS